MLVALIFDLLVTVKKLELPLQHQLVCWKFTSPCCILNICKMSSALYDSDVYEVCSGFSSPINSARFVEWETPPALPKRMVISQFHYDKGNCMLVLGHKIGSLLTTWCIDAGLRVGGFLTTLSTLGRLQFPGFFCGRPGLFKVVWYGFRHKVQMEP